MKMFIWEYLGGLTGNYHDGGGVLVVAETQDRAVELIKLHNSELVVEFGDNPEADLIYEVEANEEKIMIFPDAGCC